ncbi:hypothetical protein SMICM304S_05071 [Streptomyces microflavus]
MPLLRPVNSASMKPGCPVNRPPGKKRCGVRSASGPKARERTEREAAERREQMREQQQAERERLEREASQRRERERLEREQAERRQRQERVEREARERAELLAGGPVNEKLPEDESPAGRPRILR